MEYYVFSINGNPCPDRDKIRWHLSLPTVTYSYFSKIQFAPLRSGSFDDLDEADRKSEEFLREALPSILQVLPTAADVKQAGRDEQTSEDVDASRR